MKGYANKSSQVKAFGHIAAGVLAFISGMLCFFILWALV
jgi:hypothetical protein